MPDGFDVIPEGYEHSFLPHTFGGPWSQPLSCTRCGAIVLGKNVKLHDEHSHPPSASDPRPDADAPIRPEGPS